MEGKRGLRAIPSSVEIFLDRVNRERAGFEKVRCRAVVGLDLDAWLCRRKLRWGWEAALAWMDANQALRGLLAMRLSQQSALTEYRQAWLRHHGLDPSFGSGQRPLQILHPEHSEIAREMASFGLRWLREHTPLPVPTD